MTEHKEGIHPLCYTLAGVTSGIVARVVGQPLDVLKIRFQLQNYENGHLKYRNISDATRLIIRKESVLALWKGHVPAQILSVIYGAVQFNSFELSRNFMYKHFPLQKEKLYFKTGADFICGGFSGVLATVACQPVDVLRTRLIAQEKQIYHSIWHGFKDMANENGIRTYYKGLLPSLCMIFPYIGLHFSFYGLLKYLWLISLQWKEHNKASLLLCGAASGVSTKLILLPFDMVKKRLQVVGFSDTVPYTGMVDCYQRIVGEQGFAALYRGATPSMLKAAVVTGVSFLIYEQTMEYCHKFHLFQSNLKSESSL